MKLVLVQLVVTSLVWFLILLGVERIFNIEWLAINKYWILGNIISFLCGCRLGMLLLEKALKNN